MRQSTSALFAASEYNNKIIFFIYSQVRAIGHKLRIYCSHQTASESGNFR